ncbi:MAG: hypothetical protein GWO86_00545, partial [Planctomycetes bacterium]|nr:hypothetical protein [Planctomycetota bacterium]
MKKYSTDKVAFFALLLLGLIIAQVIVKSRSIIRLSEPVSLANTGLSVQIPEDNGWESTSWLYHENMFNLLSTLELNSKPAALVQWQYLLIPVKETPKEQIRQQALRYNGQVADTYQKNIGSLVMNWGHIVVRGQIDAVFFGVLSIGQYRTLTLEVTQKAGLGDIAEEVFEAVAGSILFTDNKLLETGAEFISNLKGGQINNTLYGEGIQNYLLIKDKGEQVSGFIAENLALTEDSNNQTTISAVSMYSVDEPAGGSEQSVFNGSVFLDTFRWVSRNADAQGNIKTVTNITLNEQGVVILTSTLPSKRAGQFAFGATMVPEILLEPILIEFINSDHQQIVLDIIFSRGIIV